MIAMQLYRERDRDRDGETEKSVQQESTFEGSEEKEGRQGKQTSLLHATMSPVLTGRGGTEERERHEALTKDFDGTDSEATYKKKKLH